jgi:hypothetical protein
MHLHLQLIDILGESSQRRPLVIYSTRSVGRQQGLPYLSHLATISLRTPSHVQSDIAESVTAILPIEETEVEICRL